MIKNYLTIAIRSIFRNKVFSLINIFGLSLGIACAILISLYIKEEWTFDSFHTNSTTIYRAFVKEDYGENETFFNTVTPFPLGPVLKENFPEIEHVVRINPVRPQVKIGDQQFSETVLIVDKDFFDVFDFPLAYGEKSKLLEQTNDIVITEATALKYFGSTDALNRVITIELGATYENFTVKAVAQDVPENSSIKFNCLISSLNYPRLYNQRMLTSGWFNVTPETYVMVHRGSDAQALMAKFPPVFKTILGEDFEKSKYFVGLQPLTDIHLNTDYPAGIAPVSNPKYSYILGGVALLVLLLACINFVTLSIGRSTRRSKEVGIRKVVGAARYQLIFQFIGEALMITILSLFVGAAIAQVSLPVFNDLSGKNLLIRPDAFTVAIALLLVVVIGIFAGSYPALVLSEFKPIAILRGRFLGNSRQMFRKILVSIQLVLAVFLISAVLIMRQQLGFLQSKDLGFDQSQVIVTQLNVPSTGNFPQRVSAAFDQSRLLIQELEGKDGITEIFAASHDFGHGDWTQVGYTDDQRVYRGFYANIVDEKFISSMRMEIVQGRNFNPENTSDKQRSIIVNEAFAREFGWTDAIGKRIPAKAFADHEIIGVVKDFNYASLYTKVEPVVMALSVEIPFSGSENVMMDNSPIPKLFARLEAGKIPQAIETIRAGWKKINGEQPFEYSFADEAIEAQYRNEQDVASIIRIACLLTIVIGASGLYALASLAIQGRVKEISIRKVLGATIESLLLLLSREFVLLILASIALSIPLTLYFMNEWLGSFEYRIEIGWTNFLLAGIIIVTTGIATVSFETVRAALSHPADKLKNE